METPTSDISEQPLYIIKELLPKDGVLVNCADQAPAPSKDFAQIQFTLEEVIFRFWRITLRKNGSSLPMEKRETHQDFLYDERVQSEIHRLFGDNTLVYIRGLASGHIDYLVRLPESILLGVILNLELEDISRLAQTNKMFNKLCNGNDLWERIYKNHTRQKISSELYSLAMAIGWRKLFFTNKIQLQMQLRRQSFMSGSTASMVSEGSDLWDLRPASIMSMHRKVRLRRQAAMTKKKREAAEAAREIRKVNWELPKVEEPPMPPQPPPPPPTQEGIADVEENPEAESKKPPTKPISPYPDGRNRPHFKDGPEDYSSYELFDPRDAPTNMDIQCPSEDDEDVIDEEAEAELRRQQKQKEYDAVTFDDWGEDFSFLGDDTPRVAGC